MFSLNTKKSNYLIEFQARLWMYRGIEIHPAVQYLAWIVLPVSLVLFAAGFVFIVAPQAVGMLLFHLPKFFKDFGNFKIYLSGPSYDTLT